MINSENSDQKRFFFGKNWQSFEKSIDESRIIEAEKSLKSMLGSLSGKSFLDIGSGSGLFSLAALRLGADKIHSLDYDIDSVNCTQKLKEKYSPNAMNWTITQGDILDESFTQSLGTWDIVYSWGVLHHTGNMHQALINSANTVNRSGLLYIAIYNDQGIFSELWRCLKKTYVASPRFIQVVLNASFFIYFAFIMLISDILKFRNPTIRYSGESRRGMSIYRDVVDWIGGYPFEVASPEVIFRFYRDLGFTLKNIKTCGGKMGCNEFLFFKQ